MCSWWCNWCVTQSTLVEVMAWCHQAPSHHLNQYWYIFVSSLGHNEVICDQWIPGFNQSEVSIFGVNKWIRETNENKNNDERVKCYANMINKMMLMQINDITMYQLFWLALVQMVYHYMTVPTVIIRTNVHLSPMRPGWKPLNPFWKMLFMVSISIHFQKRCFQK